MNDSSVKRYAICEHQMLVPCLLCYNKSYEDTTNISLNVTDIQETYGEDPYLSGELSVQYVRGLQGNDSRYVRASAGCKHFDAHGGPDTIPVRKFGFDANVSYRTALLTDVSDLPKITQKRQNNITCVTWSYSKNA